MNNTNEYKMSEMTTKELEDLANNAAAAGNKAYKAKDYESFEYFNTIMHAAILEYQAR